MKPKLSFPAGRANENSVLLLLLRVCVRLYARVKTFQKYFPRARRRTNEKKMAGRRGASWWGAAGGLAAPPRCPGGPKPKQRLLHEDLEEAEEEDDVQVEDKRAAAHGPSPCMGEGVGGVGAGVGAGAPCPRMAIRRHTSSTWRHVALAAAERRSARWVTPPRGRRAPGMAGAPKRGEPAEGAKRLAAR